MNLISFLADLANPNLAFLPRALIVAMLSSLVCGVVGVHVVLRGLSFVGDALSHAVFPGVAIAFAMHGSILLGGAIAGAIVTLVIAVFAQNRRIREDSIIGIFFAAAFALGLVIMAQIPGYTGSLESFLFGSLAGVTNTDILLVAAAAAVIIAVLALAHPSLVCVSVDRDHARTLGMNPFVLDLVLYMAIAATVVISVQSIGNILVLALLVAPAVCARLLTSNVVTMMLLAPGIGALSAFLGVWLSWEFSIPAGAAIVLCATCIFVVTWLLAPHARRQRHTAASSQRGEAVR